MSLFDDEAPSERPAPLTDGTILVGDTMTRLAEIPDGTFRCAVTSPPYWGLRDYGSEFQIGAEMDLNDYIERLVKTFSEVRRVLTDDGTFWLNIGDSFTSGGRTWRQADDKLPARGMNYRPPTPEGLKPKDLIGVPWKVAFALQADGWYLRTDVVWHKPNALPESVKDRPARCHEFLFMFSKNERYLYNYEAVKVPTDNGKGTKARKSVWAVNTEAFPEAHFATFPTKLVEPCILAGSNPGDTVLDPFFGSGTVGEVSAKHGRHFVGCELNPEYVEIAVRRLESRAGISPQVRRDPPSGRPRPLGNRHDPP